MTVQNFIETVHPNHLNIILIKTKNMIVDAHITSEINVVLTGIPGKKIATDQEVQIGTLAETENINYISQVAHLILIKLSYK